MNSITHSPSPAGTTPAAWPASSATSTQPSLTSQPSTRALADTWQPGVPGGLDTIPARTEGPSAASTGAAGPVATATPSRPGEQVLDRITGVLQAAVGTMSPSTARERMIEKYQTLRLLDDHGQWTVPELARYSDFLLPNDLDGPKMQAFVGKMADAARQNAYLMKFLDVAATDEFPRLREKVQSEGASVLPDVVLHAQMLDRLTTVLADDYQNCKACREHWKKFESDPSFWKSLSFGEKVKMASVNLGVDRVNRMHDRGEVDPHALAFVLPLNIIEAVAMDLYHGTISQHGKGCREGHRANAYAGWILTTHGPQGEAPSKFSPDGKMVELHQKETKAWDDLYQTWNMDFITVCSDWPYWMTKLAVPEVSDYASHPAEYINKRGLALQITMAYVALRGQGGSVADVDWFDPHLSDTWGKVNAKSAKEYDALAG